jgi:hypothetical protein
MILTGLLRPAEFKKNKWNFHFESGSQNTVNVVALQTFFVGLNLDMDTSQIFTLQLAYEVHQLILPAPHLEYHMDCHRRH